MLNLFDDIPRTPGAYFKLLFYAAVLRLLRHVVPLFDAINTADSQNDAFTQFPFLAGYANELVTRGLEGFTLNKAESIWLEEVKFWEERNADDKAGENAVLPLVRLQQATRLSDEALRLWFLCGLIEEDPRFGGLFAALQSSIAGAAGSHRVGAGLLMAWQDENTDHHIVRAALSQLQQLGLLHPINPDAPRTEWVFSVSSLIWDAAAGLARADLTDWARWVSHEQLPRLDDLILPTEVQTVLTRVPEMTTTGQLSVLVVCGPHSNGRRTVLAAVAQMMGQGLLRLEVPFASDDVRWQLVGPLAMLLNAMPVLTLDLAPGENYLLPEMSGYTGLVGVAIGQQGGLAGWHVERSVTVTLEMPPVAARLQHWQASLPDLPANKSLDLATRLRLTGGNIRRAARRAQAQSALHGRVAVNADDVRQAAHALGQQALDSLATWLPPLSTASGEFDAETVWCHLAVSSDVLAELKHLEVRCRHREALPQLFGDGSRQINAGVRALLGGPSGTGKTLAARVLAAVLNLDLYRLDLSLVVNKYISETEKNLSRIFARAEELDVMLLLDEGDALLTQRTQVQNSNDRYANLETSFLLQRLETFEGILLVTTNASERIDGAFARRMDVVIDFRAPEALERRHIWELHFPTAHACAIPIAMLDEVAGRCALTGGQIRNAALHASVLALNNGGVVKPAHVLAAVQREYRKMGAACPLRVAEWTKLERLQPPVLRTMAAGRMSRSAALLVASTSGTSRKLNNCGRCLCKSLAKVALSGSVDCPASRRSSPASRRPCATA